MTDKTSSFLASRFRGYYPVVIDVETAGFNAKTDALLEIAACLLDIDSKQQLKIGSTCHFHVNPFEGANLEQSALDFTGIDPFNPLRRAVDEEEALKSIFREVRRNLKAHGCNRAVMVAHNSAFDMSFVNAAVERCHIKRNPFHPFVSFDTTSLSALALGQTVLAKACLNAGIEFDHNEAHSALYDTTKTAELFCFIVNRWQELGGWPVYHAEINDEQNHATN
ncbi:MAG: Ribonuclease T [Candidatus Celerinatantimonas neptuna]|nr:MAG: Ribonuclease T [Candidatus Celerinatantimonas neptuna]